MNDTLVDQNCDMASILNTFFSSVYTKENMDSISGMNNLKEDLVTIQEVNISQSEIVKKLAKLKNFLAPRPDSFRPIIYLELTKELALPLLIIYKKSLLTGEVPNQWKHANVTAILKKGKKWEPGNYRPVSLTCIACKIMESSVQDVSADHLLENILIFSTQQGFMKKHSIYIYIET